MPQARLTDQEAWEATRLVSLDNKDAKAFDVYCRSILQKHFPNHDFVREPVHFLLMDDETVNGCFVEKNLAANDDHLILISKGLLKLFKNKSQLAFVLDHEFGHFGLTKDLGTGKNSLGEERLADIEAGIRRMIAAGENPEEGIAIMQTLADLQEKGNLGETLAASLDVHGNDDTRILDMKAKVAAELGTKGTAVNLGSSELLPDTTPWLAAKHEGFTQQWVEQNDYWSKTPKEQIALLAAHMTEFAEPGFSSEEARNARRQDYLQLVDETFRKMPAPAPADFIALSNAAFHKDIASGPFNIMLHEHLFALNGNQPLPANTVIKTLNTHLHDFIHATTAQQAEDAATAFWTYKNKIEFTNHGNSLHTIQRTYLGDNIIKNIPFQKFFGSLENFSLPQATARPGDAVSWAQHLEWKNASGTQGKSYSNLYDLLNSMVSASDLQGSNQQLPEFNPNYRDHGTSLPLSDLIVDNGRILTTDRKGYLAALYQQFEKEKNIEKENRAKSEEAKRIAHLKEVKNNIWTKDYETLGEFNKDAKTLLATTRKLYANKANSHDGPFEKTTLQGKQGNYHDNQRNIDYRLRALEDKLFDRFLEVADKAYQKDRITEVSPIFAKPGDWDYEMEKLRAESYIGQYRGDARNAIHTMVFDNRQHLFPGDAPLSAKNAEKLMRFLQEREALLYVDKPTAYDFSSNKVMDLFRLPLNPPDKKKDIGDRDKACLMTETVKTVQDMQRQFHQRNYETPYSEPSALTTLRKGLGYTRPANAQELETFLQNTQPPSWATTEVADIYRSMQLLETELYLLDNTHRDLDLIKTLQLIHPKSRLPFSKTSPSRASFNAALDDFIQRHDIIPKDLPQRIAAYKMMEKNHLFSTSTNTRNALLQDIVTKIAQQPDAAIRVQLNETLLGDNGIYLPKTRQAVVNQWVADQALMLGMDDGSPAYAAKVETLVTHIQESDIAIADRAKLLRGFSDKVVSQPLSASHLSVPFQMSRDDLVKQSRKGAAAEFLNVLIAQDKAKSGAALDYILSSGSAQETSKCLQALRPKPGEDASEIHRLLSSQNVELDTYLNPEALTSYREDFWSAELPARTYITNRLLHAMTKGEQSDAQKMAIVEAKVIQGDGPIQHEARAKLRAYTASLSESQQPYFLSAILSAVPAETGKAHNALETIGKGFAMFCAHMGPAEVKFGQGVNSAPSAPAWLRQGTDDLKNNSDVPALWEVDQWIEEHVPESLKSQIKHRGRILGAGSYFVTVEIEKHDGTKSALRLLRPYAEERAEAGFKRLTATANAQDNSGAQTDDALRKQSENVSLGMRQMITQAARMSGIETNSEEGAKQVAKAHSINDGTVIEVDGHRFEFEVMPWKSYGPRYAEMQMAEGTTLDKVADPVVQKAASKAMLIEFGMHIVSGDDFDHDRHRKQQHIVTDPNDPTSHKILIYDTGAMMLRDRSTKGKPIREAAKIWIENKRDKIVLGDMLFGMAEAAQGKKGKSPDQYLMDYMAKLEKGARKHTVYSEYLTEVQKAVLALSDIVEYRKATVDEKGRVVSPTLSLSAEDMQEVLGAIVNSGKIDPDIARTFKLKVLQHQFLFRDGALDRYKSAGAATSSITIHQQTPPQIPAPVYAAPDPSQKKPEIDGYVIDKKYIKAKVPESELLPPPQAEQQASLNRNVASNGSGSPEKNQARRMQSDHASLNSVQGAVESHALIAPAAHKTPAARMTPELIDRIDEELTNLTGQHKHNLSLPKPKHQALVQAVNEVAAHLGIELPPILVHEGNACGTAYSAEHDALIISERLVAILTPEEFKAFTAHELDHKAKEANAHKMQNWFDKLETQEDWEKLARVHSESYPKFQNYLEFSGDKTASVAYGAKTFFSALQKMVVEGAKTNNAIIKDLFPDVAYSALERVSADQIQQRVADIANGKFMLSAGGQLSSRFELLRKYMASPNATLTNAGEHPENIPLQPDEHPVRAGRNIPHDAAARHGQITLPNSQKNDASANTLPEENPAKLRTTALPAGKKDVAMISEPVRTHAIVRKSALPTTPAVDADGFTPHEVIETTLGKGPASLHGTAPHAAPNAAATARVSTVGAGGINLAYGAYSLYEQYRSPVYQQDIAAGGQRAIHAQMALAGNAAATGMGAADVAVQARMMRNIAKGMERMQGITPEMRFLGKGGIVVALAAGAFEISAANEAGDGHRQARAGGQVVGGLTGAAAGAASSAAIIAFFEGLCATTLVGAETGAAGGPWGIAIGAGCGLICGIGGAMIGSKTGGSVSDGLLGDYLQGKQDEDAVKLMKTMQDTLAGVSQQSFKDHDMRHYRFEDIDLVQKTRTMLQARLEGELSHEKQNPAMIALLRESVKQVNGVAERLHLPAYITQAQFDKQRYQQIGMNLRGQYEQKIDQQIAGLLPQLEEKGWAKALGIKEHLTVEAVKAAFPKGFDSLALDTNLDGKVTGKEITDVLNQPALVHARAEQKVKDTKTR